MICPNCGAEVPSSEKCPECGAVLDMSEDIETPYARQEKPVTGDAEAHEDLSGSDEVSDTTEPDEPEDADEPHEEASGIPAGNLSRAASPAGKPQRTHALDLSEAPYASFDSSNHIPSAPLPPESEPHIAAKPQEDIPAAYAAQPEPDVPAEPTASADETSRAEADEASSVPEQAGDTIVYQPVEQSSAAAAEPTASESANEAVVDKNATESRLSRSTRKEKDNKQKETRADRQKHVRIKPLYIVLICLCAGAAATVGIWQWYINTPRARLTQALRDGDILEACEIYDTELRDEGLTSNEVYYLCAAAEQIADDFEADSTAASYEGRLRLLDELGKLPYKNVQDAVAEARRRVESRSVVVSHMSKAAQADERGDYLLAIAEYEAALTESPGDDEIKSALERTIEKYRDHALQLADEYVQSGNIAQARMVLLEAMLSERFAADSMLRARLDDITTHQFGLEESGDAARNALDLSRLGQAAFLMQNVPALKSSTARLTEDDLMGVLMSLYEWRGYNTSPVASSEPVLAVVRDALPVSTGSAQWPYRVAAAPVQLLCDALFGERAESVNIAQTLGTKLYGSYKYEDGFYYFASMTAPSRSVAYADASALPHLDNNDYTFYSGSDRESNDRLYTIGIRPTTTSPFGFTVSSVTTVATGREARNEAESVMSRLPQTPLPDSPSPSPAASESAPDSGGAAPSEPATTAASAASAAAAEFQYAPDGTLTGGLIFPDSDMRYLTEADLSAAAATYSNLSGALELARNEIYARRGHIFSDPQYQNYYMQYAWYSPSHTVSESEFNDFELRNMQQITQWLNGG